MKILRKLAVAVGIAWISVACGGGTGDITIATDDPPPNGAAASQGVKAR